MQPVFVAVIVISPLPGCEVDSEIYAGASVRAYIPAVSKKDALILLAKVLADIKFELIEVDFIVQEDLAEWANPDSSEAGQSILEARESNEVVFSTFHTWQHGAPVE